MGTQAHRNSDAGTKTEDHWSEGLGGQCSCADGGNGCNPGGSVCPQCFPEDMSKDSPREDVEEKSHRDGSATQNKFTEAPSRTRRRSRRRSGTSKASDARQTREQDAAGENCSVPGEYAAIIGAGSSAQLLDLEHQQATLYIPIAPISQTEAGPESTLSTWLSIEVDDSDGEMQTEAGPESTLTSLRTWLSIEVDDSDGEMDER